MDSEKVALKKIFDLQQGCLERHISECKEEYNFVRDCIELGFNESQRLAEQLNLTACDQKKLKIFWFFFYEALSALINSFKLLLYGCPTDSLAVLRVSLEALVMINYIMQEQANGNDSFEEVDTNIGKRQYLKDLLKKAKQKAKDNNRIGLDYGRFSNLGSHFYHRRSQFSNCEINGKAYPRCGMAVDPVNVKKFIRLSYK